MLELPIQTSDAEKGLCALRSFARRFVWIRLAVVEKPTPAQLKAVQAHYPKENLLAVRKRMIEGTARIGPFLPELVQDFSSAAFEPFDLAWKEEAATNEDLSRMGLDSLS
jgi:hypothetical protein